MIAGCFFEANLARILSARARREAAGRVPAKTFEAAVSRCLVALRPRNRWPENTRVYAVLRVRLTDNPVASLAAFSAAAAGALYLGLGRAAVAWLGTLFGGPG